MLKTVYKSKNLIIVVKPAGTPAEPDLTGICDAMTLTSEALSSLGECDTLYLIHRLDLPVGGLLAFARNKKSAREASSLFSENGVVKEYLAVVEGECQSGALTDYLVKNTATKKAAVCDRETKGAKLAELSFINLCTMQTEKGARTLVKISLKTGRFHQIRAQFSSRKLPLVGDKKYGSRDVGARNPALFCSRLAFTLDGERIDVIASPDMSVYPWCLFEKRKEE